MLLAWLSPFLPGVALVVFWTSVSSERAGDQELKQGDRAAHAAARRDQERKLDGTVAGTVVACLAGAVLAVVGLAGIRSRTGAAVVVPGAVLGILSAAIVVVIAGLYFLAAGIKV
jgi:hypothetical protein